MFAQNKQNSRSFLNNTQGNSKQQLTNYRQWIGPSNAAQAQIESVRIRAAYPPEFRRVPAERVCHTTDYHANGCSL